MWRVYETLRPGRPSLIATRFIFQAREALGVEITLRMLFERPTVAGLAGAVADGADRPRVEGEPVTVTRAPVPGERRDLSR